MKRQRRSGDGNIHGALPVPGAGRKERSPASGEAPFELGWHHEAKFRSRPNGRDGSVLFFSGMGIFPNQAGFVEKRRRQTYDSSPFPALCAPFGAVRAAAARILSTKELSTMSKMTPRTLSGFMELLAPAEPELLWGPRH